MSSPSLRRSGRQRKPNPKYSTGAHEKEVRRLLRESSDSSHHTSPDTTDSDEIQTANNLDILVGPSQANFSSSVFQGEHRYSVTSGSTRGISDEAKSLKPRSAVHEPSIETPALDAKTLVQSERGTRKHFSTLFGPDDADILPILHVRDRWLGAEDATFPSRKTLAKSVAEGIYGRMVTGGLTPEQLSEGATPGLDWLGKRQKVQEVSEQVAQDKYLPRSDGEPHEIVIGPWNEQEIFRIGTSALDLADAWQCPKNAATQLLAPEADSSALDVDIRDMANTGAGSGPNERQHEAFILNLGEKVHCLAWAPSSNSSFQYLAVTCSRTSFQPFSDPVLSANTLNFTPSPPVSSSIQIWAFRPATHAPETPPKIDMTMKPRLVQVLCTDWGDIQKLLWCDRTASNDNEISPGRDWLGLLGVISSDGFARVLDVSVPLPTPDRMTQYLRVLSPVFAASPPGSSRFVALAFASTSELIVATCTGTLNIYHIMDSPERGLLEVLHRLETTGVSAIASAYPSLRPTMLASASVSGSLSLTDLRRPWLENVSVTESCALPLHLTYSPLTRAFITTSIGNGNAQLDASSPSMLACRPAQHFTHVKNIARVPAGGPVTALASSRWHPSVLLGTADGSVFSTNYLRGFIPQARQTDSSGAFIQKLCEYEWVQKTATAASSQNARSGRSRFHEGFKAEKAYVTPSTPISKGTDTGIGVGPEQEQAVTSVDWNPNLKCAGWLAIAWGSGLVRVQDVAHGP